MPWVITALDVVLEFCWGQLDNSIRTMKVWYRLACRRAQHSILGLGYTAVVSYVLSMKALRNKYHLVCAVSINSVLVKALTFCLSFISERQRVPTSRSAAYINVKRKARQRFGDICVVPVAPCRLHHHPDLAPSDHCFGIRAVEPIHPASSS